MFVSENIDNFGWPIDENTILFPPLFQNVFFIISITNS